MVTVSLTRVIVCVWLVSGGRSSACRAAAVGRLGWSCAFVVIDRAQHGGLLLARARSVAKHIILASRRSLVLRVLELPIIHAEDAVQLVPASHLVADAEDIAFLFEVVTAVKHGASPRPIGMVLHCSSRSSSISGNVDTPETSSCPHHDGWRRRGTRTVPSRDT